MSIAGLRFGPTVLGKHRGSRGRLFCPSAGETGQRQPSRIHRQGRDVCAIAAEKSLEEGMHGILSHTIIMVGPAGDQGATVYLWPDT
jgi:hypothetical protein